MMSCSEWTGVPLSVLLQEAGVRPGASWVVAEGGDACRMTRSVPLDKALDDVLVAYGQNGEALRPAQGYPLRLLVPGWEGNISIKWLRRLKVVDKPFMTREETSKYTDLMPGGEARQFTFVMDAKSVITRPSGGQRLSGPGFHQITGLAWSGRGGVSRVDVSLDGGRTWQPAPAAGAGATAGPDTVQARLELGRERDDDCIPLCGRDGRHAADARGPRGATWPAFQLSQQRHSGMAPCVRTGRSRMSRSSARLGLCVLTVTLARRGGSEHRLGADAERSGAERLASRD